MKVYLVEATSSGEWDDFRWVHSVYSKREKAITFILGVGDCEQEPDLETCSSGWFVLKNIIEMEVQ